MEAELPGNPALHAIGSCLLLGVEVPSLRPSKREGSAMEAWRSLRPAGIRRGPVSFFGRGTLKKCALGSRARAPMVAEPREGVLRGRAKRGAAEPVRAERKEFGLGGTDGAWQPPPRRVCVSLSPC